MPGMKPLETAAQALPRLSKAALAASWWQQLSAWDESRCCCAFPGRHRRIWVSDHCLDAFSLCQYFCCGTVHSLLPEILQTGRVLLQKIT